jgi:hypothetical protein
MIGGDGTCVCMSEIHHLFTVVTTFVDNLEITFFPVLYSACSAIFDTHTHTTTTSSTNKLPTDRWMKNHYMYGRLAQAPLRMGGMGI